MYKYFIALRYLKGRMITWFAVAGVAIGVMALVIVTSVMGGFQSELHNRIRGTMGHINIESRNFFGVSTPGEIENAVTTIPHVIATSPYIESIALFSGQTLDWGQIRGMDPVKEAAVGNFDRYILTEDEAEAYGKIEIFQQQIAESREKMRELEGVISQLIERGVSRETIDRLLPDAEDLREKQVELLQSSADARYIKKVMRAAILKWEAKFGVGMDGEELEALYNYAILLSEIEKRKTRIAELEEIKEKASDREPCTVEDVTALFTSRRLRPKLVELSDGTEIYGRITSENESHVTMKIPLQDEFDIMNNIRFMEWAFPKTEISGTREISPIVVGVQWYKAYNVRVHDTITIITVRPDNLNTTFSKEFEVVGAFKTGMFDTDYRFVYTDLDSMESFLDLKDTMTGRMNVSGVAVRLEHYQYALHVKPAVENAMAKFEAQELRVITWEDKHKTLLSAVKTEKWLLSFILFFMIIIAGFMNLCILTMMVVEKTRDLGIIKAVGGTTGGVFSIFLFTGGFIGIIGTVLGCVLGGLFTIFINEIASFVEMLTGLSPFPKNIYYLDKIPAAFLPWQLTFIIVPAVLVSFLFSLYPAFRAAQLDPIEAFHYE